MDAQTQTVPTLVEFLRNVAAGAWAPLVIAFLLEHVQVFQSLQAETKKWTVLGIFLVLPVAASALLQYVPADVWVVLEPFWSALALGFAGWTVSQVAHQWDKRKRCNC
jgi:hypothetical protein